MALPPGIDYALGALVFFGLADLVYKRGAAAGAQPHQFLMVQSWVFAPLVVLYGVLTGTLQFVAGSLWGALAGFFILTGFYNFAYSLKTGSISLNAPVFRLSFVLSAALAVLLLGEPLTPAKVAGIALALAAAWLLLGAAGPTGSVERRERRSALIRVIVATLCVGVGNFLYALGLRDGATPASIVIAQAAVVVTLALVFTAFIDRRIRPSAAVLKHAPQAALMLAFAFILMAQAMARAPASVVVPIAPMGFVVTALTGFLLLREPFTPRKGAGILVALAALASLANG